MIDWPGKQNQRHHSQISNRKRRHSHFAMMHLKSNGVIVLYIRYADVMIEC